MHRLLFMCWLWLSVLCARAQSTDSVAVPPPSLPPDFVQAYVVVCSPGDVLYSALGHAGLRLVCDTHQLDYVYHYTSEDLSTNYLKFFAGKLRMRAAAFPTADFLAQYETEGREVTQYELRLPVAVKQHLWQQMDQRLQQPDLPFDYLNRGCAITILHWLRRAIPRDSLVFGPWAAKYHQSRKELGAEHLCGWSLFFLSSITSGEVERTDLPMAERLVLPTQLVEVLQGATAYGLPLLDTEPEVLLQGRPLSAPFPVSPLAVSLLFVALMVANVWLRLRVVRWLGWSVQCLAGVFIAYLVVVSDLPCTQWNWLLIPFNPLPLLCWRWRRYWLLPFAVVCLLWVAVLVLLPHRVVVDAHYWLAVGVAALSLEQAMGNKWLTCFSQWRKK